MSKPEVNWLAFTNEVQARLIPAILKANNSPHADEVLARRHQQGTELWVTLAADRSGVGIHFTDPQHGDRLIRRSHPMTHEIKPSAECLEEYVETLDPSARGIRGLLTDLKMGRVGPYEAAAYLTQGKLEDLESIVSQLNQLSR